MILNLDQLKRESRAEPRNVECTEWIINKIWGPAKKYNKKN
jgi:hypothetical protein